MAPDTPAQAIRCALALQAEKPLFITAQRISLTAGRAFAGAVGSQNRREYTVVGAIVNLSARLTRHCPDGAVVLDENSAMRVWNDIELDSLPSIQVKGSARRVAIYRVIGERSRPIQMQTRFAQWDRVPLGREKERAILEKALDKALRGEGGITVIYGPFGGGQTPLLAAGVRYWLAHGGRALAGVSQLHMSDMLFAPWQAIWRDLFGLTPDMTPEAALEQALSLAAEFCPDCGDDIQLWREPLSLPAYTGRLRPMPARAQRLHFFHLALQTLAAAAARQPLLVVLEDAQWADQSSLDLLYYLADSVADLPIMLLATYHQTPGFVFRALNHARGTAIFLDNLPPERAREIARERLGLTELPLLLEQRLGLRDRQGQPSPVNPLFLEESLKTLLVSGALLLDEDAQGHGRVRVDEAKLLRLPIPDTVYAIMLARLDQLSPAAHALLQVAAVIGREFDLPTLLVVVPDVTGETAAPLLDELTAADMLHLAAQEPTPVYMFQHSVLHDAVYQSVPYARRQAIHTAVADLILSRYGDNLQPWYALLAYHYSQTDQNEAGLRYALLAADDARAVFANKEAAALYRQALVHLEALGLDAHWQTAVRIYTGRAEALHLLGLLDQAAESAAQGLKLAQTRGAPFRAWPLLNLLADIRLAQGRYTAVWSLTEQVVAEGKRYDWARACYLRGLTAVRQMDGARAAENLAQAADW
ncbi:MAG TPA: adenylate/guanylate cyclase domain-containing protein, partial [Anaerolineae bacterium]|nr:adenylate/guanylate cyclase domain-containing protein [Anaerolineae bacterium]